MADVFPTLSTVEEIVEMHAKLESLKLTMAARRHGGAGKSGRYMKHDTARLSFIDGQALRDLACGKLPSAADQRALFDLPGDLEIAGKPEEKEMDAWRDQHHADPRSKAHKDAGLSVERQTTLLGWVHRNAAAFARPSAPVGTMSTYKLGFGPYAGYTLMATSGGSRGRRLRLAEPGRFQVGLTCCGWRGRWTIGSRSTRVSTWASASSTATACSSWATASATRGSSSTRAVFTRRTSRG